MSRAPTEPAAAVGRADDDAAPLAPWRVGIASAGVAVALLAAALLVRRARRRR